MLAKHALSQLSYAPVPEDECSTLKEQRFADAMLAHVMLSHVMSTSAAASIQSAQIWWAWEDLNFRPHAYQARALTN